jgi:hypothetical protein
MKKVTLTILLLILAVLLAQNVLAQDWLEGWDYRRPVTIANPCEEALTDFQAQIVLEPSEVMCAMADCTDLRVTADDGLTPIPFWIETLAAANEPSSIWVKVPSLPIAGATVYLYYNNSDPPVPEPVEVPPIGPWDKVAGNPIVPLGDPGGGSGLLAENIVYDDVTGHYWLLFAVYRGGSRVGLAWSDDPGDPTSWTWHGIVINYANAPHIIEHDGTWYIFYADRGHGGPPWPISVATAPSVGGPYTWAGIVLTPTEPWEAFRVDEPYVFQRNDGKWIMMYMGDAGSTTELIGYAEADNITEPYTKFGGNPCIPFGPPGSIDAGTVADPWVVEFHGTYYIGYTVSSSKSSPWRTAYATTTDWVTFNKHGITLDWGSTGEWDQCNAFRGAVTRFGDTYYFPYTGRYCSGSPISGYIMGIATQPAWMLEEINNTCEGVFEFCDTFEGDALDTSKWTVAYYPSTSGGSVSVSGGILTMTGIYPGPTYSYGYVQMRGNTAIGTGTLLETYAGHADAGNSCDPDSDTDNAAEVGYKQSDMTFGRNLIRIMDYPFSSFYTINSADADSASGYVETDLPLDTEFQEYEIFRNTSGNVDFWVDGDMSSFSLDSNHIPTIDLYPWLMSYAEFCQSTTDFEVDWIRVRKYCGVDALAAVGDQESSNEPPVADPNGPYLCAAEALCVFDGTGSFDPDGDALTYAWDFGDSNSGIGATPTHTYGDAGIYDVCLTVNDGNVNSEAVCTIAVVYDPDGGFVTGGGWIDSPAGAYKPDESLTGKATFGFVSKYKRGSDIPTGNTEFQFHAGDLNFHSSSYDWLVVTGSGYAKFKGSGTINGEGDYKFMIWAGNGDPDTFRIRIWTEDETTAAETDVYDNGFDQPIGGGSIVIHTK